MSLLDRVQKAITSASYPNRKVIDQGPFRILIDPKRTVVFVNYAVVLHPPESPVEDVANLVTTFESFQRVPRIEYAKQATLGLDEALSQAGFKMEHELPLMACTPETFRPRASGVEVRTLGPADDVRVYYRTANQAFDVQWPVSATPIWKGDADKETGALSIAIGYIDGEPVGCACMGPTWELSGVGVVPEFRRRGVASAVSTRLLENHFTNADLAWLTAEDESAEALYRGLGFKTIGAHQAWAIVPHAV